jgi:hypothetical protein
MQKVGEWSIPRKPTGVDRYYTNFNSLPVPRKKMIFTCCIMPYTFDATPLTVNKTTVNNDILYSTFSIYDHDNTTR